MPEQHTPSLLEPESRGGENAGQGFDFQDHYLVSQIPCWLERDGFMSLLHEAISDIEVKFFLPGHGENIEMIEAKNHRLTPAIFWDEIDRFYAVDQGSPDTFRWFRLVAPTISDEIASLQHGLRRIRSPYSFYSETSGVIQNSLADFAQLVAAANKPLEYAEFLFNRVLIDTGHGTDQKYGEASFRQNLGECLPEYHHLPYPIVSVLYTTLLKLVSPRNTPITRKAIEETMRACIPSDQLRPYIPVRLHTAYQADNTDKKELVLDWFRFFGGSARTYPETTEWDVGVITQLNDIKEFVLHHRSVRHIRITGSRRLSASLAIGHVFSATSGFTITMEHRDRVLCTNDHAASDDKINLNIEFPQVRGQQLVVCIGIPNDIREAVENFAHKENASHLPILNLSYLSPVENARQANSIIAQSKTAILQSLSHARATHIHLFCAIPSFIALFLGHRLNATAPIQCYEFVAPDTYVPTCVLNP